MRDARLFRLMALLLLGTAACGSQSLGDVARQERQRQAASPNPSRHVITNEDLKTRAGSGQSTTAIAENSADPFAPRASYDPNSAAARELQTQIKDQKQKVQDIEKAIQELQAKLDARGSAGGVQFMANGWGDGYGPCGLPNSVYNPNKDWCDQGKKMQAAIDTKQGELSDQRAQLEALQEQARKLGFSSKFYDPD